VEPITTFRIPRYLLARLAAEEYVRQFWWFVLVIPLFGALMMVLGTGLLRWIGYFALAWPITIPTRAVLGGWKAGTFFSSDVQLAADDENLYFAGPNGKGMKLAMGSVRKVIERHGFLILRFGIGEFVAIPREALGEKEGVLVDRINRTLITEPDGPE
jgi:hypothetical protein